MRLINPGPGEILDRLAILSLKIEHAPDAAAVEHFMAERLELERAFNAFSFPDDQADGMRAAMRELAAINEDVWELIDLMRKGFHSSPDSAIARWAKRTMALNDLRAELVNEINIAFGLGNHREKI